MREIVAVAAGTLVLVGAFMVGSLVVPLTALWLLFGWLTW